MSSAATFNDSQIFHDIHDETTHALRTTNAAVAVPSSGLQGGKTVAAAGTPERLVATTTASKSVVIVANPGNSGRIAVGFSNAVRAATGTLNAAYINAGEPMLIDVDDLNKIFLDAEISGEGVVYTYVA